MKAKTPPPTGSKKRIAIRTALQHHSPNCVTILFQKPHAATILTTTIITCKLKKENRFFIKNKTCS
ncbi:hypothetical protein OIU79_029319, partial [Salix purpurea]